MADIMTPALGESVTEATVARWAKKAGDAVRKDEILVELETDKVSLEVASPADGTLSEIAFEGKGCAISTAATSLLTDELIGMSREELLRLPKDYVLELLGIDISATRMKCAMLGLKIVKSAALGQPAEWEDEGETGSPAEAATF